MWGPSESHLAQIWSATDADPSWTGGGNTATQNATPTTASGFASMRSSVRFANTSKIYFEFTTNSSGLLIGIGVANATMALSSFVGADTNGVSYYQNGTWSYNGAGVSTNAPAASAASSVLCVAWDGVNQMIYVRIGGTGAWNGNTANSPATNTGGFNAPISGSLMAAICGNTSGSGGVLNAGSSTFSGAVPLGFIPLDAAITTD